MSQWHLAIMIVGIHYVADFIVQTNHQAINKSKSNYWLSKHVATYSLCLCALIPFTAWWYPLVNGIAHWCTDYATSRVASKFYADGKRREFFVIIGLDQFLHYAVLFLTA